MRKAPFNPYLQVLQTYVRRANSSFGVAMFVFAGLAMAVVATIAPRQRLGDLDFYQPFTMAMEFLSFVLLAHFREQIAHPRRWLMPRYLSPHLVVFATFALLLTVALPGFMIAREGLGSVGLIALGIGFFAVVAWWVLTLWAWIFFPALLAMYVPMFNATAGRCTCAFVTGQYETVAYVLLAVAIAAAIAPIVLLCRLTEESHWYGKPLQLDRWSVRARMTGETNEVWAAQERSRFLPWPARSTFSKRPVGKSLWSRSRRWSPPGSMTGALLIVGALGVALIAPEYFLFNGLASANQATFFPSIPFLTVLPLLIISQTWLRQWRFLEADSLRPITRGDFLKEVGMAMGKQFALEGIAATALMAAGVAIFGGTSHFLPTLPALLIVMLGTQVLGSAMSLQALRHRTPGRLTLMMMPLAIVNTLVLLPIFVSTMSDFIGLSLVGGVVLAIAGTAVARDAGRRWLDTELG